MSLQVFYDLDPISEPGQRAIELALKAVRVFVYCVLSLVILKSTCIPANCSTFPLRADMI